MPKPSERSNESPPIREYRPRLNVEITEEQLNRLQDLLPWGLRNQLFCAIVDDVIEKLANPQTRLMILAAIIGRHVSIMESAVEKGVTSGSAE